MKENYKILADGLDFPESPSFDPAGRLWFTESRTGTLSCWQNGKVRRFKVGEIVNGAVFDAQGTTWVTDSGKHELLTFNFKTGDTEVMLDQNILNRPNDLAFDREGNLLITCHADAREEPGGYLIAYDPVSKTANKILERKYFPNGIAISQDNQAVYYAETYNQTIWKATWDAKSMSIKDDQVFTKTPGPPRGPDGLFLTQDSLFSAMFDHGCVIAYALNGKEILNMETPGSRPTSCTIDPTGQLGLVVTEAEKGLLISYPTIKT